MHLLLFRVANLMPVTSTRGKGTMTRRRPVSTTAIAVLAGAAVTAGCAAPGAAASDAPTMTVSSDAQCTSETWRELGQDYLKAGGAIWIGIVTASKDTAQVPISADRAQTQTFTRVNTTATSILAGELPTTTVSGWVSGGVSDQVVTEDDGTAWAADGRALIFSYPGDDPETSPRLDIAPIVGDDVITGIAPCLGPRDLAAHASTKVRVNTARETGKSAFGLPVPLSEFKDAFAAGE